MKKVNCSFSYEEIKTIKNALEDMPHKLVAKILANIDQAIQFHFDQAVSDIPSGAITQPDPYSGD
jgi:hypothetical protein